MTDVVEKKKVKVTQNIYEHGYLSSIALNQLDRAKEEQAGHKFRWVVPSMAFSVFKVEALCNIYGSQLFPHWNHFESSSFIGKIVMISEFLKIEVDFSREPWQTLNLMKTFRNTLAHAKPQKISVVHEIPKNMPDRAVPFPRASKSILSYSSVENAEQFSEVSRELEMLWSYHAQNLGLEVDTVGAPVYEVVG